VLRVNNIDVYYGEVQALWGVSLEVQEGEIVTLIGSNGAGKTTTLRTIAGLLHPASGTIEFEGEVISGLPPYEVVKRKISLVPEGRRLFPLMTTLENLELGSLTPDAKAKRKDSLDYVFEIFPLLKERRNQLAGTLSGGEQQMLAIARGLMSRPKLLMLDEPSLGLAPILVEEMFDIVKRINQEGVTILLVEQNIDHALKIADRGYVLETGKITMYGNATELLEDERLKEAYLGM